MITFSFHSALLDQNGKCGPTTRCSGPVPTGRGPLPRELASAVHLGPLRPAAERGR